MSKEKARGERTFDLMSGEIPGKSGKCGEKREKYFPGNNFRRYLLFPKDAIFFSVCSSRRFSEYCSIFSRVFF